VAARKARVVSGKEQCRPETVPESLRLACSSLSLTLRLCCAGSVVRGKLELFTGKPRALRFEPQGLGSVG